MRRRKELPQIEGSYRLYKVVVESVVGERTNYNHRKTPPGRAIDTKEKRKERIKGKGKEGKGREGKRYISHNLT